MVSALIAFAVLAVRQGLSGPNLVVNSNLVRDWEGWTEIWCREESAGQASIVAGRTERSRAVFVKYTGSKDWALSQQKPLEVKPGDVYEVSAWMKTVGGTSSISVVSHDANASTIQWELGQTGPQKPGWQYVHRHLAIPANCTTIQFRIVGTGAGQTWVESPSLFLTDTGPKLTGKPVILQGKSLTLTINSDGSMLAQPNDGKSWRYRAWTGDYALRAIKSLDSRTARLQVLDFSNDLQLTLQVQIDTQRPEATIAYESAGPMSAEIALPGNLVTETGEWVVLPMNEGIRLPVDDRSIDGWSLITYGGHGLCMPWSGVTDPATGRGTMTIIETPDDADVLFQQEANCLTYQPRWEASHQAFGYNRKLRLCYFNHGGFVAMAKRYRAYAKETGLFRTLAAKRTENPNVDRLIGAVNVWNWDMDKVALCREMKQLGFGRVLWSSGGTAAEVKAITDLGYLPGIYDIYQDVWDPKHSLSWQNTEGWPQDLVLDPNGDWMKGWAHPDKHADGSITWYQGGVISSGAGLARAKRKIPPILAETPYLARFIDTTTASPFREDYNPAHPLTRSQDRANKMALLEFCSKDMKQVVGTETGIDPSVPVVEYYEGMMSLGPFRLPDAGTFMMEYRKPTPEFLKYQIGPTYRIPLWELVYHDCTVAQWYWGDATNKAPEVWNQRDLWNILYGTAPLLMFDSARWQRDKSRMLQTYHNVCDWTRKIGYDGMLAHEDLTPDHRVQRTTFSSGRSVTVNFGDAPYQGLKPMSYRITEKR